MPLAPGRQLMAIRRFVDTSPKIEPCLIPDDQRIQYPPIES